VTLLGRPLGDGSAILGNPAEVIRVMGNFRPMQQLLPDVLAARSEDAAPSRKSTDRRPGNHRPQSPRSQRERLLRQSGRARLPHRRAVGEPADPIWKPDTSDLTAIDVPEPIRARATRTTNDYLDVIVDVLASPTGPRPSVPSHLGRVPVVACLDSCPTYEYWIGRATRCPTAELPIPVR